MSGWGEKWGQPALSTAAQEVRDTLPIAGALGQSRQSPFFAVSTRRGRGGGLGRSGRGEKWGQPALSTAAPEGCDTGAVRRLGTE